MVKILQQELGVAPKIFWEQQLGLAEIGLGLLGEQKKILHPSEILKGNKLSYTSTCLGKGKFSKNILTELSKNPYPSISAFKSYGENIGLRRKNRAQVN